MHIMPPSSHTAVTPDKHISHLLINGDAQGKKNEQNTAPRSQHLYLKERSGSLLTPGVLRTCGTFCASSVWRGSTEAEEQSPRWPHSSMGSWGRERHPESGGLHPPREGEPVPSFPIEGDFSTWGQGSHLPLPAVRGEAAKQQENSIKRKEKSQRGGII